MAPRLPSTALSAQRRLISLRTACWALAAVAAAALAASPVYADLTYTGVVEEHDRVNDEANHVVIVEHVTVGVHNGWLWYDGPGTVTLDGTGVYTKLDLRGLDIADGSFTIGSGGEAQIGACGAGAIAYDTPVTVLNGGSLVTWQAAGLEALYLSGTWTSKGHVELGHSAVPAAININAGGCGKSWTPTAIRTITTTSCT